MVDVTATIEKAAQHHHAGRLKQAEVLYKTVTKSHPDHSSALHSLGMIACQRGQYDLAAEFVAKAIAANRQIPQFHNTLGVVLAAVGKTQKAIDAYRRAISLKPDYAEAYANMADTLQSQGQYPAAVENCKKAIQLQPALAEAYYNMANILRQQDRHVEAVENYQRVIRIRPDFAMAYGNLAVTLKEQGRDAEAIESYKQAIRLMPADATLRHDLGIVLKDCGRYDEATENYKQAIRLDPDYAQAYNSLGVAMKECNRCTEAIENYEQAIRLKPDYADAHWNRSLALLLSARLSEGWKEYQRRYDDLNTTDSPHYSQKTLWDGSSFDGKTLLVRYQQGLGDNIQFVRYLPMVKERGGTVIYETKKPLTDLLRPLDGIDELVAAASNGKPAASFDLHISLMDLPRVFGATIETIPSNVPYLYADPAKAQAWRNRIVQKNLTVGIVWAGAAAHRNDRNRSCTLADFAPLAEIDGIQLYGLQKGNPSKQADKSSARIIAANLGEEFEDFTDTAAAIGNMDLVVSVDTAVLHLAGAMGKPTWALLPFAPDWRWMLERQDSPWYPTMRLFRQKSPGCWPDVFADVKKELQTMADKQKVTNKYPNNS